MEGEEGGGRREEEGWEDGRRVISYDNRREGLKFNEISYDYRRDCLKTDEITYDYKREGCILAKFTSHFT